MALSQLLGMRLEAAKLLDTIISEDQMDLVETIIDREEEEAETGRVNMEPLLVTVTDLDDTSRSVLGRLRELKDDEKKILHELKERKEIQTITAKLLREEIDRLEQTSKKKTVKVGGTERSNNVLQKDELERK